MANSAQSMISSLIGGNLFGSGGDGNGNQDGDRKRRKKHTKNQNTEPVASTKNSTPSMKKGGKVKKTGVYKLHRGEVVVPTSKVSKRKKAYKKTVSKR